MRDQVLHLLDFDERRVHILERGVLVERHVILIQIDYPLLVKVRSLDELDGVHVMLQIVVDDLADAELALLKDVGSGQLYEAFVLSFSAGIEHGLKGASARVRFGVSANDILTTKVGTLSAFCRTHLDPHRVIVRHLDFQAHGEARLAVVGVMLDLVEVVKERGVLHERILEVRLVDGDVAELVVPKNLGFRVWCGFKF